MRIVWGWLAVLLLSEGSHAIEPFFAPPVAAGQIEVRLHPTDAVLAGATQRLTFGMPFPRGSITEAGLASVRVLHDGVEIPAHVSALTPWRHRSNAAIDGQSVRVALIQVSLVFAGPPLLPEDIVVAWGGAARTLDVATLVDPRSDWHAVASGSFVAADNVSEPDVYAVLPASWLSRGLLTSMRSEPFAPGNPEARDDPAVNDGILGWPGFEEAERAHKNNFYTVINQDTGSAAAPNPYRTTAEPWLYDRASTMFRLYFRSGSYTALREAVRNAQFYADRQNENGFFNFGGVGSDAKYAYNECLAYVLWTTGDPQMAARIARTPTAQAGFAHAWTPQRNFWTERHAGFKLLANVVAYEVLGNAAYRDAVDQILADYRAHQDGGNGGVPSPRVDGGLYHTGQQHDPAEFPGQLSTFVASSWMSALISEAAVRAYATREDAATAQFIARLGNFLAATLEVRGDHAYQGDPGPLATPRYAMRFDGATSLASGADAEHALDVTAQLAWARYFREFSGDDGTSLRDAALDLYATYDASVNSWIRPTAPPAGTAYRVSPSRKWAWEHRTSDGLGFAMSEDDPNAVFEDGFENP